MRSISVNSNYDIHMDSTRNLGIVVDKAAVKQDVDLAAQLLLTEFPFDTTRGVDYMGTLFQNKNPYAFEESLKSQIKSVPNVTDVSDFQMFQDGDVLQYNATVTSSYGAEQI